MNKFVIVALPVLLVVIGIGIYAYRNQINNNLQTAISPTSTPLSITPLVGGSHSSSLSKCLPADIKLTDIVSAQLISHSVSKGDTIKKVTVDQKLTELQASCNSNGKLVDGTGKVISFYNLTGCWGNPPQNYEDILAKQRHDIEQLS